MKSPLGALATLTRRAIADRSPVPYAPRSAARMPLPLSTGPSSADALMRAMGSVGTLFSIVDRLASSQSAVEWHLYRKARAEQRPEDRAEVVTHAALDLWNRPNPFFTRALFIETFQQHYELVGEADWVVARAPGISLPLELWPVSPARLMPVPDPDNYLAGWEYLGPDGQRIPLGLDEVIQIRRPNPIDPYRGIGAVQTILADLQGVALSAEWNRSFFLNSAEPGGVVEFPDGLEDDEYDDFVKQWREQHQGVRNAHRVALIEKGKWVKTGFSQRDMQFTELRDVSSKVIREAFGIPKFAVGDVEDVNRATAEAAKAWFAEQMTVPRAGRIREALNSQLLPMFGGTGKNVEFDFCDVVPADREADDRERASQTEGFERLVRSGAHPDDAAEAVGLPRMRMVAARQVPAPPDGVGEGPAGPGAPGGQDPAAPGVEAAMRWVAVEHIDDSTCDACRGNDGRLYRNRADAYDDYPGGEGYVRCEGRGNCRGKVVKRRKGNT